MKFTLPLSIVLVALGVADARPAFSLGGKRNATVEEIFAKRQTTRDEITNRAHVKDTVKRVHAVIDTQVEHQRKAGNYERAAKLNVRQAGGASTTTTATVTATTTYTTSTAVTTEATSTAIGTSITQGGGTSTTFGPAETTVYSETTVTSTETRAATTTIVTTGAGGQPTTIYQKRAQVTDAAVQKKRRSLVEEEPLELVKKSNDQPPMAMMNMRPRGQYPRCDKTGAKTGYAHYPGWKLSGDDLSGGIPVTPESACVLACNKYGGACSGIYFDSNLKRCFLKGVHTTAWDFEQVSAGVSTDLVGGCALWANVVPAEMDAVCCRG